MRYGKSLTETLAHDFTQLEILVAAQVAKQDPLNDVLSELMEESRIPVQQICDSVNSTWNIMTMDKECLMYGTIEESEQWLLDNMETYYDATP